MVIEPDGLRFSKYNATDKLAILRPGGFGLTDRALQLCAFKRGDRVVDIGCGFGTTVEYLRDSYGLDALGIDSSTASLARGLWRNPSLQLRAGFAEKLPLDSGALDGILAECSLSVIANKEQALAEFCRVLRPGGKLAVSDVYARNSAALEQVQGIRLPFGMTDMLTRGKLAVMLERQGFAVRAFEDHSPVLKEYVFHAIMGDGSTGNCSWRESVRALKPASLGYFLMIAEKEA